MSGSTLGPYVIVTQLGRGGMGVVYEARDPRLKRTVAIKLLPPDLTKDETAKQRFLQEAQAASALDHPNICTIHEINETDDGQLYLVMAHYEGETLKERIERGPLELDDAVDIATQVGQGLAEAHGAGIVHRDIKPANLLVTKNRVVKILDFGLAKLAGSEGVTQPGTILGTVTYMSPEQVQGSTVDHRTDIWSLGVVCYELLAGRPPFVGESIVPLLRDIADREPPPLSSLRPDVPSELADVVGTAMEKAPESRYSAQGLTDALRAVIPRDSRGTTPVVPPVTAEQEVHFCQTPDGISLAYACIGQGPPLVRALGWFSHLEREWQWPAGRRFWERLAKQHLLVRYDGRGMGLSERRVEAFTLDSRVEDLETVVDACGLDRFALLGTSEGGAAAIAYAARHPERVSHLILCGAWGRLARTDRGREQLRATETLIRSGWGRDTPVFRQLFTNMFLGSASAEEVEYFNEMQRASASADTAARCLSSFLEIDVEDVAPTVQAPTLVIHRRDDQAVPFERGRKLASLIPGARLLPQDGSRHWLLMFEDGGTEQYVGAIERFVIGD